MNKTLLLSALLALLSACTPSTMSLPSGFQGQATAMVVAGRNKVFNKVVTFGDYTIDEFRQSWTSATGGSIGAVGANNASNQMQFQVRDGGTPVWSVQCGVGRNTADVNAQTRNGNLNISLKDERSLACTLLPEQGAAQWTVQMRSDDMRVLKGILQGEGATMRIAETYRVGAPPTRMEDLSGYLIRQGGEVVAAVDLLNQGTVWFSGDLPAEVRSQVAATAAALLLCQMPSNNE